MLFFAHPARDVIFAHAARLQSWTVAGSRSKRSWNPTASGEEAFPRAASGRPFLCFPAHLIFCRRDA
jgi:hypothetical protein